MSASDVGGKRERPELADLGLHYLVSEFGATPDCPAEEAILGMAERPAAALTHAERDHLAGCRRCASLFASYRSVRLVDALPERWHVRLEGIDVDAAGDRRAPNQVLGRILLESARFERCEGEAAWQPHPLCVRLNLVIDPAIDHFCLTLLEVPDRFEAVSLKTPRGWQSVEPASPDGTFELWRALSDYFLKEADTYPLASFLDYIEAGLLELVFAGHHGGQQGVDGGDDGLDAYLLSSLGALERGCDYELPCGLHADTHINAGKLCHSEQALHAVAASFNALFRDVAFDTVVANGWAMATVARRLAALRSGQTACGPIREIMYEGYVPPLPVEDLAPGSRVLILVDVVITGGLLRNLGQAVHTAGGEVVARGCLVDAGRRPAEPTASLRVLARLPIELSEPGDCPRCGRLEPRAFNPFAGCMTARAPGARSPSEFLAEHPDALELWRQVGRAGAYQHHKIEGNAHYTAFVDTARLLKHPEIGRSVVERLRDLLAENRVAPGAILAPNRQRARLLAVALKDSFEMASGPAAIPLVWASCRSGRWHIAEEDRKKLTGEPVLLVDSAAGHGKTLDVLSVFALRAGARSVAASVLLSRLTAGCTAALAARLSGGFYSLYQLPIRPVVIHGLSKALCPVCQRRAAVHEAAIESRHEAIERWDAWLSKARRAALPVGGEVQARGTRTDASSLFPDPAPSFFETCSRAVASGVALHSLYAARTNGMAPLALPEITNEAIPPAVRAAMLEYLPPGVVAWSRGALDRDLERCLATAKNGTLWRASAEVLARERHARWLDFLDAFLTRAARQKAPPPTFWNALVCNVYLVARQDAAQTRAVRQRIEQLHREYTGSHLARGLKQILDVLAAPDHPLPAPPPAPTGHQSERRAQQGHFSP
jgi:orotate phosphoribosyltransferase